MARDDIRTLPPVEELRRLLSYDPETGVLRWLVRPHPNAKRSPPGSVAGTVGARGYLLVGIGRKQYFAHRIIWKIQTGEEPTKQIDHRDTDRLNNRWLNLRAATNGENRCNSRLPKNNRSGVKGVFWDAPHKAWRAFIGINGERRKLGRFKDFNQAVQTRRSAEQALHGEFARPA